MANTKAYIQSLQNKDGADVYPVTVADAVYVQASDGSTITQTNLSAKLTEMEKNFTDGCNTIVSALTELGVTPEATTPAGIAAAIKKLYSDRYTSGVEQGHKDVIADPGGYGLITKTDYDNYGEEQYNKGVSYADSRVNTESASYVKGKTDGAAEGIKGLTASAQTGGQSIYQSNTVGAVWGEVKGEIYAYANIENGVLTVYTSGNVEGIGQRWEDDGWTDIAKASATVSKRGSTTFAS